MLVSVLILQVVMIQNRLNLSNNKKNQIKQVAIAKKCQNNGTIKISM